MLESMRVWRHRLLEIDSTYWQKWDKDASQAWTEHEKRNLHPKAPVIDVMVAVLPCCIVIVVLPCCIEIVVF